MALHLVLFLERTCLPCIKGIENSLGDLSFVEVWVFFFFVIKFLSNELRSPEQVSEAYNKITGLCEVTLKI